MELYTRVKDIQSDRRSTILSSLYGLVECTSAKILLSVARVVFAVSPLFVTCNPNLNSKIILFHPFHFAIAIATNKQQQHQQQC